MEGKRKGRAEEETLEPPSLLAGGEPSPLLAGGEPSPLLAGGEPSPILAGSAEEGEAACGSACGSASVRGGGWRIYDGESVRASVRC